jgi:phosphoribosylaminoimidazole carboxylase
LHFIHPTSPHLSLFLWELELIAPGGQLGRMLMEAANRLNIQLNILDAENAPAKQISAHAGHITGSFKDAAQIQKLAESCDVITVEIEHVDTEVSL